MADLSDRIQRLERLEEIHRTFGRMSDAADAPYDPEAMVACWTEDGHLDSGDRGGAFSLFGHEELRMVFSDLPASFSIHYWVGHEIDLDESGEHATGSIYGWEVPVISGRSIMGAFTGYHRWERQDGQWKFKSFRQVMHFMCLAEAGWEAGPRAIEQVGSLGA